jgi:hypothetical protein
MGKFQGHFLHPAPRSTPQIKDRYDLGRIQRGLVIGAQQELEPKV